MFSLIITIISIALVGALAATAVYYGGPVLNQYNDRARAARLVSEGTQVRGAAELYRAEKGKSAEKLEELIGTKYLVDGIKSSEWASIVDGYAQRSTNVKDDECILANKVLQIEGIPSCDDPKYAKRIVCCKQDRNSAPLPAPSDSTSETPPPPRTN